MPEQNPETIVVGKSIYLELRDERNTRAYQLLITPKSRVITNPSNVSPPTLYRRMLSTHSPKRQWKCFPLTHESFENEALPISERLGAVNNVLDQLLRGGYKVLKEPIIVDTSMADIAQIRDRRTPYKLLGRIEKVRKAKGFPDKVVPV